MRLELPLSTQLKQKIEKPAISLTRFLATTCLSRDRRQMDNTKRQLSVVKAVMLGKISKTWGKNKLK